MTSTWVTDPAALRAADSLLVLPSDPTAAIEEVLRRREEGGFSYLSSARMPLMRWLVSSAS